MKVTSITASEANRSFSKLLRAVARGEKVEITSHGRKVAMIAPIEDEDARRENQLAALQRLERRWAKQEFKVVGPWTRDDLNARD